ncbi:MAG: TrmH family RNA methyltransferase [Candidatus Latescibacterota bacterium]|nr:TrmH family RNA methyltransferase [Candidatus Latescibacterota bacterium]MDP7361669.1 TrmH family RNA methyltransferase [Candidatus Latescibacterota bacterium]MEC8930518.1 TrmH family RNA methyltransferase [Candidatus Latescibacterota bacterium]MEC8991533.1 TrmH family RNA methyltransferase [Candidatus Latescibacterota bacterium]MEC9379787.1 TrmH family RNA methyltransferase [Candidatus Latescibacterota bacterium]
MTADPRRQLRGKALNQFLRTIEPPAGLDMVFVLQDMQDPINVGSAFRIADAAGVRHMVLTGITTCPPHPLIKKVGRGRDRRIHWDYAEDAATALEGLRDEGYRCVAVELASDAQRFDRFDYPAKLALVVGHEDHGVTHRTLGACDGAVYLPMHGKGASLNVHVSLGIVAYHVLSRFDTQTPPDERS